MLALIVGLLLIVSTALPFITVEWMMMDHYVYWASGLTIASGYPRLGLSGYSLVYLIPVGGIIVVLSAALAVVLEMKPKARVFGLLVLVGGLLALVGGIMTRLHLDPLLEVMLMNESIEVGIGLFGALLLGTVEIILAATILLRKQI